MLVILYLLVKVWLEMSNYSQKILLIPKWALQMKYQILEAYYIHVTHGSARNDYNFFATK